MCSDDSDGREFLQANNSMDNTVALSKSPHLKYYIIRIKNKERQKVDAGNTG